MTTAASVPAELRAAVARVRRVIERRDRIPWELRYRYGAWLASELRRRAILATHRHCTVEFQGWVGLGPGFSLSIPDNGTFICEEGVQFRRGFHCEIYGEGRVVFRRNSFTTYYTLIQCSTSVEIGEGTGIGQSVIIVDGYHRYRDLSTTYLNSGYDYHPITIGRQVQILAKATILDSIGDHSVIGANAVVTRPIPAYCLAVGSPARVIDYFGPPELRPEGMDAPTGT